MKLIRRIKHSPRGQDVLKTDSRESSAPVRRGKPSLSHFRRHQIASDRHDSPEDLELHRLPRSESLPSILSPKLADEDLNNSTTTLALIKTDDEVHSTESALASKPKHQRKDVEKESTQTKDTTELVVRTPTKFTSSAKLDITIAKKEQQKSIVLQDSPSSPLPAGSSEKTYLLPRIQPQIMPRQVSIWSLLNL